MPATRFASIAYPSKYAYLYDTGYYSDGPVNEHFRMYETYGDGLTQHSSDWALQPEYIGDYLISLATAMLKDDELAAAARYQFNRDDKAKIEFAASIIYKADDTHTWREKKDRYFSMEEKRITTSANRQYDKRYEKVTSRQDGTPLAIMNLVCPEYAGTLDKLAIAIAVREYVNAQPSGYMELAARFIGLTKDHESARRIERAYEACEYIVKAYCLRENAHWATQQAIEDAKPQPEPEAETKTATE